MASPRPAVRTSRGFFGMVEGAFRTLGLTDAADNLRHYRSGKGGTQHYDDQIAKHLPVTEAEDHNRTLFESTTFTGQTKTRPDLNKSLAELEDGQSFSFRDYYKKPLDFSDAVFSKPLQSLSSGFGIPTYTAFGRGDVMSDGTFTASRKGARLTIRGTVKNRFDSDEKDNMFDFNPDQPGSHPGYTLEHEGEAVPFRMQYDRRQDVEAELHYESDNRITLDRAKWGKVY